MLAGNGELVLVVDDEAAIRQITQETLEAYGYRVLIAADGAEAVALYAQHAGGDRRGAHRHDDAGDGRGRDHPRLAKMNPRVRIIATSGAAQTLTKNAVSALASTRGFLAKPYTAAQLLTVLREVLAVGQP